MSKKSQEWKKVNILKEQRELIQILVKNPLVKAVYAKNVSEFVHIAIAEKIKIIFKELKEKLSDKDYSELFSEFSQLKKK